MSTEIIISWDPSNPNDTTVALNNPPTAWLDALTERQRQIRGEGCTPEYDDQHDKGEMAEAAATYALHSTGRYGTRALTWPWGAEAWKPTSRRRDLVKAAALILAEIERLDRAALRHPDAAAERAVEDRADG